MWPCLGSSQPRHSTFFRCASPPTLARYFLFAIQTCAYAMLPCVASAPVLASLATNEDKTCQHHQHAIAPRRSPPALDGHVQHRFPQLGR
ncbi:hypothetical protein CBOM_07774 [Ceraceosorus bombacis]|uniref:Uncharacterized protein n=1 Tax=Ceraceosorus bombacis TaxID=401625 RepID=A0A0P1BLW4_9BASI|nr:hypothetical protein CBOM_07774 [Ceraceosorus bombacis]